jgi:hypothetical protein
MLKLSWGAAIRFNAYSVQCFAELVYSHPALTLGSQFSSTATSQLATSRLV